MIRFNEIEDLSKVVAEKFGVDERKVYFILLDYCDSEETRECPDNYDELLEAEIKDIAESQEMSIEDVRKVIDYCDLTDTLVDARVFKIEKGWC